VRFEFSTATRIVFGAGTVREAGPLAGDLGRRALVVTGHTQRRATALLRALREQGADTVPFAVSGEPTIQTVTAGTSLARDEGCDLVIGIGGGAVLDAGKAIAAMLTNEGELLDYLEIIGRGKTLGARSAPFVAIPTTAGTGSEVTRNAVLTSPENRVKVSLRSPLMLPAVALVDPELTCDLPPNITAATGADALAQLIEPFVCTRANPMTDAFCVEGIARVARSLRKAFATGHDAAAREDMAVASLFGGLALANAGLGAVHGLAGVLGGMFPAPHGAVCAALLPHVVAANVHALRERGLEDATLDESGIEPLRRYQRVAALLTGRPDAAAEDGTEWLRALAADLDIPPLRRYGVASQHVPQLIEHAARASSMKANPVLLTPAELAGIVEAAL